MRIALGVSRTAVLLLAGVAAGCVTASPGGGNAQGDLPGLSLLPPAEQQQVIDSLQAEQIAQADGPRVRVTANFENDAGSRRVEAYVHADDDAYVLVGHIDATGRLRIVYPARPTDDGFVRGGHVYRVPSFFGGFVDEYRYRRATDYTRLSMVRSRTDSYDAGTGYVFVIASWRPMQLERVTDGNRWSSYELSSEEYLTDPREAVDELAQVVAGDSREAYTVEYAHYVSTNYGMYSANSFDRCSFAGFGSFGYRTSGLYYSPYDGGFGFGMSPWYGFNSFFGLPTFGIFSPFSYAREYDALTGCSYYVPVYFGRPRYATTWPFATPPAQPGGRAPFLPERPRPPRFGGEPSIQGPTVTPAGTRQNAIAAGLEATDINGMHRTSGTRPSIDPRSAIEKRPSIEQMIRRRRVGESTTEPGMPQLTPTPPVERERPRFAPPPDRGFDRPRSQPRVERPPETRPPEMQPHVQPARPAPQPHFAPPPMRMEPMHEAPRASSGSSGSGGEKHKP